MKERYFRSPYTLSVQTESCTLIFRWTGCDPALNNRALLNDVGPAAHTFRQHYANARIKQNCKNSLVFSNPKKTPDIGLCTSRFGVVIQVVVYVGLAPQPCTYSLFYSICHCPRAIRFITSSSYCPVATANDQDTTPRHVTTVYVSICCHPLSVSNPGYSPTIPLESSSVRMGDLPRSCPRFLAMVRSTCLPQSVTLCLALGTPATAAVSTLLFPRLYRYFLSLSGLLFLQFPYPTVSVAVSRLRLSSLVIVSPSTLSLSVRHSLSQYPLP